MSVLEIPQGLLGGGPLFPIRLDRIAKLGQGGLGGQGRMRASSWVSPANSSAIGSDAGGEIWAAAAGRAGGRAAKDCAGGAGRVFRARWLLRGRGAGAGAAAGGFGGENPNNGAG